MPEPISSLREELTELTKSKLEEPKEVYLDYGPLLPDKYYQDRIVLLVRDPECIFAYWEFTGPHTQGIISTIGEYTFRHAQWLIRLHNLSQSSYRDRTITPPQDLGCIKGSWYFNDVCPDTEYCVEIGLITSIGSFISLAWSNAVKTPRRGPALDKIQPEVYVGYRYGGHTL